MSPEPSEPSELSDPSDRSDIRAAFVEAYPTYVARVLTDRGIEVDDVIADAVVEGTGVLDASMAALDSVPVLAQRTSPLELFREALRPVERALRLIGAGEAADVGGSQVAWDPFGLAPGSSQVLGERAHDAHLAWAVRKAAAMAPLVNRPVAIVATTPDRRDALASLVEAMGYRVPAEDGATVAVALVDVGRGRISHEDIRRWNASGVYVVAFGDDVDDLSADGLRALGADVVVITSALIENPAAHLPAVS